MGERWAVQAMASQKGSGTLRRLPAGVVAAEPVGRNSLAFGLKEKDFALGFRLLSVFGRGGCPLPAGFGTSGRPAGSSWGCVEHYWHLP